jgi:predicted transposase YbfD/YdcC
MEYTPALISVTKPDIRLDIALSDIQQAFATVADPRRAQGRVYWLSGLLCLAVAAILCGQRSVLAIAEWGQLQSPALRTALGLPSDRAPDQSTLHRVFRRLDPAQLSLALSSYFDPATKRLRRRAAEAVAVDGKAHRGQLQFERVGSCTIHQVTAFCHETGLVLAQIALDNQGGEAELNGAARMVANIDWQGRVLTGDALYCQRAVCAGVLAAGGDYLVVVKENQPELLADLAVLFAAPEMVDAATAGKREFDYREASTWDKGHGRIEERRAVASSELRDYSGWPGLQQVVRIRRTWVQQGRTRQATHYLVTSLPAEEASSRQLMALRRGHWLIENRLHYVKDVTLGEDSSLIHAGNGGAVMAGLREAALNLLRRGGTQAVAAAMRFNNQRPEQVLILMGLLNSSDA